MSTIQGGDEHKNAWNVRGSVVQMVQGRSVMEYKFGGKDDG